MSSRLSQISKVLIWSISGLVGLLVLAYVGLYFQAQNYLNNHLPQLINEKSKGKYELRFEKIKLDFPGFGFTISDVSLNPVPEVIEKLSPQNRPAQLYQFYARSVRIRNIALLSFFHNRHLTINTIQIQEPDFKIVGRSTPLNNGKENLNSFFQELKPVLSKSVKSIRVKHIILENANYNLYNLLGDTRKVSNAENISIGIENFYTDSVLLPNPGKLFDADDIYIRLQNYENHLADSVHILTAVDIRYSLSHARIEAKNVDLKPGISYSPNKSLYLVHVPEVLITNEKKDETYQTDSVRIDSLVLKGATISFRPREYNRGKAVELIRNFNLFDLVKNEFKSVSIRTFALKEANLKLYKNQKDTADQQEFGRLSVQLNNFYLDSLSGSNPAKIFYSDQIKLAVDNYELTLGDGLHRLKTARLRASTTDSTLTINNITLYPIRTQSPGWKNKTAINVTCDSVKLSGTDFLSAFHSRKLLLQQVSIFNPQIRLDDQENQNPANKNTCPSLIYQLISVYMKAIYATHISVGSGNLEYNTLSGKEKKGSIKSEFKFSLTNFALDSISAAKSENLFYANNIDLEFSDYRMKLLDQVHQLTIGKIEVSSFLRKAEIRNLHLSPVLSENVAALLEKNKHSELYNCKAPSIIFQNTNIHKAFFNKKLDVGTIRIEQPEFYFENFAFLKKETNKSGIDEFYQLLSNYLTDIHIEKLDVPEANVKVVNHSRKGKTISVDNKLSLGLENFRLNADELNSRKLLFSDQVELSIHNHMFRLSDNVHVLRAGELGFSTKTSEAFVSGALLYPDVNSPDYNRIPWHLQVSVPEIRLIGVDLIKAVYDRELQVNNFLIKNPEIKFYKKNSGQKGNGIKQLTIPVPNEIKLLSINSFILNNGNLKIYTEEGAKQYLLAQSKLKMQSSLITVARSETGNYAEFHSGEFSTELTAFSLIPEIRKQQIGIDRIYFSTASRSIEAQNISIGPKAKSTTENQFDIHIPAISLTGFDLDAAYRADEYLFDRISLSNPSFTITKNRADSLSFNPFKVNLYPYFERFANVFAARTVSITDATVVQNGPAKPFKQNQISVDLKNFKVDKNLPAGLLHASDYSFRINNLKWEDKKGYYGIIADKLEYSSANGLLSASNIAIKPTYTAEQFSRIIPYQTDYFSGSIGQIRLNKPQLDRWFEKRELNGNELCIDRLNLDIFRNKLMPFNHNQRPLMPQDLLKTMKTGLNFDSLCLINSTIAYSERIDANSPDGRIEFSKIKATIKPFSNQKTTQNKYPDLFLKASASLMNEANVQTSMRFNMNSSDNSFYAEGNVSPFSINCLNPMLEPATKVSIRSGITNRFEFQFSANNKQATGHLFFGYDDLKVSVLEFTDEGAREAKFASFIANSLLLRSRNPRGKELEADPILFQRDQERSILNYWWKTVFSGVKNTLGIKENK